MRRKRGYGHDEMGWCLFNYHCCGGRLCQQQQKFKFYKIVFAAGCEEVTAREIALIKIIELLIKLKFQVH